MKARVIDINRDEKFILIDLVNYHNKVCLHTHVRYSAVDMRIYYISVDKFYDLKKQRCVFVKNIGEVISKAFLILGYDESEIESIVFNKSKHELEYASITFRKDKENGANIDK